MKKIGIFSIREQFSYELLQKINSLKKEGIRAEFPLIGETKFNEKSSYQVIVDRVSSHVGYFKVYFKNAALTGTHVMNDPFCIEGVERFQNYCKAKSLGLAVPRTLCLPTREYHPDCGSKDLGNLQYPLHWEEIGDFIGFPAILKPYTSYGYRDIFIVRDVKELINCYDGTKHQVMIMQELIPYDYIIKAFIVGSEDIFMLKDNKIKNKYENIGFEKLEAKISSAIEKASEIAKEKAFDFITTEIALKDGVPYAYNFINPFPDCREEILTEECYKWCLDKLAHKVCENALLSNKVAIAQQG